MRLRGRWVLAHPPVQQLWILAGPQPLLLWGPLVRLLLRGRGCKPLLLLLLLLLRRHPGCGRPAAAPASSQPLLPPRLQNGLY